jgi:UDP-glucuronate decarboxylase
VVGKPGKEADLFDGIQYCARNKLYGGLLRILVTGGGGFLGSHLSRKLLGQGHEVLVADNFFTGSKSNIMDLLENPRFELIRHDICTPLSVEVDAIYHLACPASPVHYQKFPVQTIKTSILGSINMLDLATRLQVPILFSSTSEVYGDPNISPQVEEYWGNVNPIGIRACYDEGKRASETLFFDYQRQYSTKIKVARIFNTYGPNMSPQDGRVVSNFVMQALLNKEITIYGDGSQTRSFCYVSDLINGLEKLMTSSEDVSGPINIGNPTEFTMVELANTIINLTKSSSKVVFKDLPQDDPKQRKPSIEKAASSLGWSPTVNLDEGLALTIEYFKTKI